MTYWIFNAFGIKAKLTIWLCIVIFPIAIASMIAVDSIDVRLTDRIQKDLMNARRLEAARITDALDRYRQEARTLAVMKHVTLFLSDLDRYQNTGLKGDRIIGGIDGFAVINAGDAMPLQQLAETLLNKMKYVGSEVVDISIRDRLGNVVGQTEGFSWKPYQVDIVEQSIQQSQIKFGNAFRVVNGDERIGLVAPVVDDNKVVGALVIESRLGPIVDLVVAHEGFGETSESHIAQPKVDGNAEFITLMRFARDAAFNKVVPKSKNLPINWSLESLGGQLVRSPDYRAVDSILAIETLPDTGWGLVVKIDAQEAFEPVAEVKKIVMIAAAIVAAMVLLGWIVFLRPLGGRLQKTAQAAQSIADGNLNDKIGDLSWDEIGNVSRSIDKLAQDLSADMKLRQLAEEKLQYQATHDELTGLKNRKYGNRLIAELDQDTTLEKTSILFMDLDGFKGVNDTYGHSAGDLILCLVSNGLKETLDDAAVVIRWGGDEFLVILPGVCQSAAEKEVARIKDMFSGPFVTEFGQHMLGCSIGLSTTGDDVSIASVLQDADEKMYVQKNLSHQCGVKYSEIQDTVLSALQEDRVEVWYQPIFSDTDEGAANSKGFIVGAEAAVRIRTIDGSLLEPNSFLHDIADLPLAAELDIHVHRNALEALALWRSNKRVSDQFYLSLNVGNALMASDRLYSSFVTEVQRLNLSGENVELEIGNTVSSIDSFALENARKMGVRIAVANTGYDHSNLDRLVELMPDVVKIDRRWLERFGQDSHYRDGKILPGLVRLCRELEFTVAIVGADQRKHVQGLNECKATQLQGRLLSPFQSADMFIREWGGAISDDLPGGSAKAA